MEGLVNISDFIDELKSKGLVIAPEVLVQEGLKSRTKDRLRRRALSKKALSYKEIADAELWGTIGKQAVKLAAENNAKQYEILEVSWGKKKVKKLIIAAVIRIAKQRGQWD